MSPPDQLRRDPDVAVPIRVDRTATLSEQAYQQIRSSILFYQLAPGSRVSETSLTRRFKLRQAAVRSALLRLNQEGLVDKTDERNPRVAPLTLKDVRDIYGLRLLLEPQAAQFAADLGLAAADLARLRRISRSRYELTSHAELVAFLQANREFNLLNASDIRTMQPGGTLVVSTNRNPVLVAARGYFEERRFKKMAALGAVTVPVRPVHPGEMATVRI